MINGMIEKRTQGFTHEAIARHFRVSERTVRRHTQGVVPRLEHARDGGSVGLVAWGMQQFQAIQQRERLEVFELDMALKAWRKVVADLDDLVRERLERDELLRSKFLLEEVWPPIHLRIDTARLEREDRT